VTDDDLDPREAARARRRDRDADAAQRELMRPGMGKVFKQILDAQAKAAQEAKAAREARSGSPARSRSASKPAGAAKVTPERPRRDAKSNPGSDA
jgi:hypothetical protein